MKIVHISTFDHGGAARSALRLHKALLEIGEDSHVLVLEKSSSDSSIETLESEFAQASTTETILFKEFQSWYIKHNRTALSNTFFSLNEPGLDLSSANQIAEADILHLHWVSGLLSPGAIGQLQKTGKPVFWTLHDQRPFTGGCHFSAGCLKFQADCHGCPQLDFDPFLLTRAQLQDAAAQVDFRKIHFCSPSQWLASYAESSALINKRKVQVIPYGIDTERFTSGDKAAARQALGLPQDTVLLLFSADNANEKRKGFPLLLAALQECKKQPEIQKLLAEQKLALVCLGHPSTQLSDLGIPVHSLGYINSDEKVVQAYQAADCFVLPSLEDNLPNTVMEAMSCGTPVAAFSAGGIPEMVTSAKSGLLAPAGDVVALAANLVSLIVNPKTRTGYGEAARNEVLTRFPLKKQAAAYKELYLQTLGERRGSPSSKTVSTSISMAPAGTEVSRIVAASSPAPLQRHLYTQAQALAALKRERDSHVATLHDQLEYIGKLKKENEEVRQQLEAKRQEVNRQQKILKKAPVKVLRALKIV